MRQIRLPSGLKVILSDTVGFISELPTDLVAAFRATLEEVTNADLILHVRDAAHEDSEAQRADVEAVLETLGLTPWNEDGQIEVLNKADLLSSNARTNLETRLDSEPNMLLCSAVSGEGIDELLSAIDRHLTRHQSEVDLDVELCDGAAIAWLYDHGQVLSRHDDKALAHLRVKLEPSALARFYRRQGQPAPISGTSAQKAPIQTD